MPAQKNILLVVIQENLNIITQSLYCLENQRHIKINEIVAITTALGKDLLLNGDVVNGYKAVIGANGVLEQFCKEYKREPPKVEIEVLKNRRGYLINDLVNPKSVKDSANSILSIFVNLLCSDNIQSSIKCCVN